MVKAPIPQDLSEHISLLLLGQANNVRLTRQDFEAVYEWGYCDGGLRVFNEIEQTLTRQGSN